MASMSMKKSLFKCLLAVTVAFVAATTVHADTTQDAGNAYAQYLEDAYWVDQFALEDLNGDGIQELKVAGEYGFYTYCNGAVTKVTDIKAVLDGWYPQTGAIFYSRGFKDGSYFETGFMLENGYLREICSKDISSDNIVSYTQNESIPISEEEYYALVEAYSVGEAEIPFQQEIQNTAENRNTYLLNGGQTGFDTGNSASPDEDYGSYDQNPPAQANGDYLLPQSASRYLTEADIAGFTLQELSYARNEIAARHGRKFNSVELREYFSTKSWYSGTMEPDDYTAQVSTLLNEYENYNSNWLYSQEFSPDHPAGYLLDAQGYDITLVRGYSGQNFDGRTAGDSGNTQAEPANLAMYGLCHMNQNIFSTGSDKFVKMILSPFADLSHNGQFTYTEEHTFDQNEDWLFDFDQDGEDELLIWSEDDVYGKHWKLFDKRDGIVYQIAEDCGAKPGNAGHRLEVMRDGTIHDNSNKGMVNYITNWDGYIFCQDGDIHYLYGYTNLSQKDPENYTGEYVLTEEAYALDGEYIDKDTYTAMVESFNTREVPYPVEGEPRKFRCRDAWGYEDRLELAALEGWDPYVDGTLDGQ